MTGVEQSRRELAWMNFFSVILTQDNVFLACAMKDMRNY